MPATSSAPSARSSAREGRTIFYTGDVQFDDQTIMQGARFPEHELDVLIIETTRGDRATPEGFTRAGEELRFAEAIKAAFDRGTLEFAKAKRRGIYIDYLQNTRGKTTAGPYSVRPIRRAPVSAPLRWDEIPALGRPDAFTIANLAERLASVGDVLSASIGMAQKTPARSSGVRSARDASARQRAQGRSASSTLQPCARHQRCGAA